MSKCIHTSRLLFIMIIVHVGHSCQWMFTCEHLSHQCQIKKMAIYSKRFPVLQKQGARFVVHASPHVQTKHMLCTMITHGTVAPSQPTAQHDNKLGGLTAYDTDVQVMLTVASDIAIVTL